MKYKNIFIPVLNLHYEKLDPILCIVLSGIHQCILFIFTECITSVPYQYCIVILQGNQIYIPTIFMYLLLWTSAKLWIATICFIMSVCPFVCTEQLNSHLADLYNIWYLSNFWNLRKFQFHQNLTRITGTLHEDQ